jgi:hypothetical protein
MESRALIAWLHAHAVASASPARGRGFNAAASLHGGAYLPCVQFRNLDATITHVFTQLERGRPRLIPPASPTHRLVEAIATAALTADPRIGEEVAGLRTRGAVARLLEQTAATVVSATVYVPQRARRYRAWSLTTDFVLSAVRVASQLHRLGVPPDAIEAVVDALCPVLGEHLSVRADAIAAVEPSPFALPTVHQRTLQAAGETRMGMTVFVGRMDDGAQFNFAVGDPDVEFIEMPAGYTADQLVAVLPGSHSVAGRVYGFTELYPRGRLGPGLPGFERYYRARDAERCYLTNL